MYRHLSAQSLHVYTYLTYHSNIYTLQQETPPDNEFEKRIRPEVIPAHEIGVTFDDIGKYSNKRKIYIYKQDCTGT